MVDKTLILLNVRATYLVNCFDATGDEQPPLDESFLKGEVEENEGEEEGEDKLSILDGEEILALSLVDNRDP